MATVAGDEERRRHADVCGDQDRASQPGRDASPDRRHDDEERRGEGGDLDLAEAERERVDQPREQDDGRDQEHRHLRGRRQGDLGRELDLAAVGDDHGTPVLRRVPDDGDDHRGDEEVRQPDLLGERLERADEDLGDERRHDGGDAERGERRPERPGIDLVVARDVNDVVAPKRVDGDDGIDDEECDRDRHREIDDALRVGAAAPARDRRNQEEPDREPDHPEREEARPALDGAVPARDEREPEHEQEVADHRSRQRAADDLGQPLVDGDQGDDQLRGVAERGVEEAADPRPGVLRRVLGRLADQPGERDQGDRGEHEQGRVPEIGQVVEGDDEGTEGQAGEKYSSDHGRPATLPAARSADAFALSAEVGKRKPHAGSPGDVEPDATAATPADVLRLLGTT